MASIAVRAADLTKEYVLYDRPRLLAYAVADLLTGRQRSRRLRALDRVSLELEQGKTLGVIGVNGAGKSTMLRLISGISAPTSGRIEVQGRVASLLEFGAGFDARLTARENVFLNGVLLGIPRHTLRERLDEILAYADLADHADAPLYTFSSGMSLRLGFAIALQTEADILLFDEVLAVGDVAFQAKCLATIEQFKKAGKTMVFVSHDLYDVGNVCDEVLLLNRGKMEALGAPHDVIQRYWSELVQEDSRAALRGGNLRVDFVGGKIYLWWGPKQLTKGFCGYTSLRSFVRWHESDKASWKIVERSDAHLVAEGTHWGLPIRQRWTLALEGSRLDWSVDIEATAAIRIERQQANFMLSDAYRNYLGPTGSGELGPFRQAVDDDWKVEYACPAGAGPIGFRAVEPTLPEVRLACTEPEPNQEMTVVSSDLSFRGRLLQCRRTDSCELAAGAQKRLFRGTLTVGG